MGVYADDLKVALGLALSATDAAVVLKLAEVQAAAQTALMVVSKDPSRNPNMPGHRG